MSVEVGSKIIGKVTGIKHFGAFVELPERKNGLVHISEVADQYVEDINDHLSIGQEVEVKVLSVGEDGKISLSIKRQRSKSRNQDNAKNHLRKILRKNYRLSLKIVKIDFPRLRDKQNLAAADAGADKKLRRFL